VFSQATEYPGANCATGGVKLSYGADTNRNGSLDVSEATGAVYVCNVTCGSYTCGGTCGTCSVGSTCTSGACVVTNVAPTPGSAINFTGSSGATVKVNWGAATDDNTAVSALEYKVVWSTSNNLGTVANAEANGTVGMDWTANVTTATVGTGLAFSTTYHFAVLVKDGGGLKSLYTPASTATASSGNLTLGCPAGKVAVGVFGYAGAWFDRLGVRCATVSGVTVGAITNGPNVGGTGGAAFTYDCPAGSVLARITGHNGTTNSAGWCNTTTTIDQTYQCRSLSTGALLSASSKYGEAQPGNCAGDPAGAFDYQCPSGKAIAAISANADATGAFVGFTNGVTCSP
jgi:hypothetical protein